MISFNRKYQNTKFYFSQDFRNRQINIIFRILNLPFTNENKIFINKLLINNNNDLYNFYFPKKPFYISNKEFLTKLGNKGVVETSNQILELLRQKEIQEQLNNQESSKIEEKSSKEEIIKEQENDIKTLNEKLTRPTFSSLEFSDDVDPNKILDEKIKERRKFEESMPSMKNHKTPEDVGLVPIKIEKRGKGRMKQIQNDSSFMQNSQEIEKQQNSQNFLQNYTEDKENGFSNLNDEQEKIQDLKPLEEKDLKKIDLKYNIDEFKPEKPQGKIDFSKEISKELLMENINGDLEDTNYTDFTKTTTP